MRGEFPDLNGARLGVNLREVRSQTTPSAIRQIPMSRRIETVDLDGDGDNDVVTERAWHENLVGGTLFATHQADWRRGGFSVADIDQDTNPDIVSSPHKNAVNWYEQRLIGDVMCGCGLCHFLVYMTGW
ncbi:MAG: VCBS repeat-containing protein [Planctomycetota bacterium]